MPLSPISEMLYYFSMNGAFLEVFPIYLPALRQHREDIPLLITEFVARYNRWLKKQITRIDQECLNMLQSYEWPGEYQRIKECFASGRPSL